MTLHQFGKGKQVQIQRMCRECVLQTTYPLPTTIETIDTQCRVSTHGRVLTHGVECRHIYLDNSSKTAKFLTLKECPPPPPAFLSNL